ncbi:MAG: hypothetical protein RBT11_19685 [Desulfobacterales bacterium]|jgi:hypothetical protein|nr:hypothetical protein [Desulfobacterales bacterium]
MDSNHNTGSALLGGKFVSVTNYMSNIRGYHHVLENGRVTISNVDAAGEHTKAVITVKDGSIATQSISHAGKQVFFCEYGKIEKENGATLRFRKGTNRALDGLCTRKEQRAMDDVIGTCKTLYKHGRVVWQKFYHQGTRRLAYHFIPEKHGLVVKRKDGSICCEISGKLDCRNWREGLPVMVGYTWNLSSAGHRLESSSAYRGRTGGFVMYGESGEIKSKGQFVNAQKADEWVENGVSLFFINGLQVDEHLYHAPAEALDPKQIMAIKNVDVRSIFIARIGMERIAKAFKLKPVHEDNGMVLFRPRFPKKTLDPFNILKVVCTTTKQEYFLRVPPDIMECEHARQWTFGVSRRDIEAGRIIRFDIET